MVNYLKQSKISFYNFVKPAQDNKADPKKKGDFKDERYNITAGQRDPQQIQDGSSQRGRSKPEAGLQRRPYFP